MNIPFEDGLYNIQPISGHLGHVGFTTRHPGAKTPFPGQAKRLFFIKQGR